MSKAVDFKVLNSSAYYLIIFVVTTKKKIINTPKPKLMGYVENVSKVMLFTSDVV